MNNELAGEEIFHLPCPKNMNDFALAPIINNSSISSKKDYIIIKKIGQGATATVYKVKCVHDNLIYH